MKSTDLDVRYVARLARLELSDEEAAQFQAQLAHVLEYASTLDRADVTGIDLGLVGSASARTTRPDLIEPGLTHAEALANAPARSGEEFLTVRVVD